MGAGDSATLFPFASGLTGMTWSAMRPPAATTVTTPRTIQDSMPDFAGGASGELLESSAPGCSTSTRDSPQRHISIRLGTRRPQPGHSQENWGESVIKGLRLRAGGVRAEGRWQRAENVVCHLPSAICHDMIQLRARRNPSALYLSAVLAGSFPRIARYIFRRGAHPGWCLR